VTVTHVSVKTFWVIKVWCLLILKISHYAIHSNGTSLLMKWHNGKSSKSTGTIPLSLRMFWRKRELLSQMWKMCILQSPIISKKWKLSKSKGSIYFHQFLNKWQAWITHYKVIKNPSAIYSFYMGRIMDSCRPSVHRYYQISWNYFTALKLMKVYATFWFWPFSFFITIKSTCSIGQLEQSSWVRTLRFLQHKIN
jgi:hypothetical protein